MIDRIDKFFEIIDDIKDNEFGAELDLIELINTSLVDAYNKGREDMKNQTSLSETELSNLIFNKNA